MKKPAIPQTPRTDRERIPFDQAMRESLETIMGRRGKPIEKLPADASLGDVVAKVNEIIDRLQQ